MAWVLLINDIRFHVRYMRNTKRTEGTTKNQARRGGWRTRELATKPEMSERDGTCWIWQVPDRTVLPNRLTV